MGYYEDDRIRNKNKIHNQAMETYQAFKKIGMSDQEILQHLSIQKLNEGDKNRYDIYKCIEIFLRSNKNVT